MSATISNISIGLSLDTGGLAAGLDRAQASLIKFSKPASALNSVGRIFDDIKEKIAANNFSGLTEFQERLLELRGAGFGDSVLAGMVQVRDMIQKIDAQVAELGQAKPTELEAKIAKAKELGATAREIEHIRNAVKSITEVRGMEQASGILEKFSAQVKDLGVSQAEKDLRAFAAIQGVTANQIAEFKAAQQAVANFDAEMAKATKAVENAAKVRGALSSLSAANDRAGLSPHQTQLLDLKEAGASNAELSKARSLLDSIASKEAFAHHSAQVAELRKQIRQSGMTELQKKLDDIAQTKGLGASQIKELQALEKELHATGNAINGVWIKGDSLFKNLGRAAFNFNAIVGSIKTVFNAVFDSLKSGADFVFSKLDAQFNRIQAVGKQSSITGLGTQALSALNLGASLNDVDPTALNTGLQKLTIELGKAKQGNLDAVDSFAQLGISQEKLASLSPEDAYRAIADAVAGIPDPAQQAAVATGVMGDGAAKLLPLLKGGSAALDEFAAKAQAAGSGVSAIDNAKIDAMDKSLKGLSESSQGFWTRLIVEIAPWVTSVVANLDGLKNMILEFLGKIGEAFGISGGKSLTMSEAVETAFRLVAGAIGVVMDLAQDLLGVFQIAASAIAAAVLLIIQPVVLFGKALNTVFDLVGLGKSDMIESFTLIADAALEETGKLAVKGAKNIASGFSGENLEKALSFFDKVKAGAKKAADAAAKTASEEHTGPLVDPLAFTQTTEIGKKLREVKKLADEVGKTDFEKFVLGLTQSGNLTDEARNALVGLKAQMDALAEKNALKGVADQINRIGLTDKQIKLLDLREAGLGEDAIKRIGDAMDRLAAKNAFTDMDKQLKDATESLANFGKTAAQIALDNLRQKPGVTADEIKAAEAKASATDAALAQLKKLEDGENRLKSVREAAIAGAITPLQEYQKTMADIQELFKRGLDDPTKGISLEEKAAAEKAAFDKLHPQQPQTAPKAFTLGSAEQQRLQFQLGNQANSPAIAIARQQLNAQQVGNKHLAALEAKVQPAVLYAYDIN